MKDLTNVGTELKFHLTATIGNKNIQQFDKFSCSFYTTRGYEVTLKKGENNTLGSLTEDGDGYNVIVDTKDMAPGLIMVRLEAQVVDTDAPDNFRTEIRTESTGIKIYR